MRKTVSFLGWEVGNERVSFRNIPKQYYSERFRKVLIPEGWGFMMFHNEKASVILGVQWGGGGVR